MRKNNTKCALLACLQVFESSVVSPKLGVCELSRLDLRVFSLLSPLFAVLLPLLISGWAPRMLAAVFNSFFFNSRFETGTHLNIFIVVSPIVTHFFSLFVNYKLEIISTPFNSSAFLPVAHFIYGVHNSFDVILCPTACFGSNGSRHGWFEGFFCSFPKSHTANASCLSMMTFDHNTTRWCRNGPFLKANFTRCYWAEPDPTLPIFYLVTKVQWPRRD